MRKARFGCIVFCALSIISGCRTPYAEWTGAWELNRSRSSFQGPVITISISADGEYHYSDGIVSNTFRCDGKYRPMGNNRTQACVKSSATTLDSTRKENGIKTNTYHWELSAGGKAFTSTATSFRPDGSVITAELVASRISGSDDFAGQWRDESYLQRNAELTLRLDRQYLHVGYPSVDQHMDLPLNGSDAAAYGSYGPGAITYAVLAAGQREFLILGKRDGKAFNQTSLELSRDGRVLTDSSWKSDQTTDKSTLVYKKK